MEINQSLSIHRITKQYHITVHFHLILNKQYAYVGVHRANFMKHFVV